MKRENAGSWDSGWKRSKYWKPILHSSKSPETPRIKFLELIRISERKKYARGPTPCPGDSPPYRARLPISWAPWWASGVHLLLYHHFYPRKNYGQAYGTKLRRHEAEPWQNQSRAPVELFCRGHFPPGGGNHCHRHHQLSSHRERAISINIFTSTISSQTLVHLLYPILVSKSGIGTCRLLVVLITPCS